MNLHRNDVKSIKLLVDPFIDDLLRDINFYREIHDQFNDHWDYYFTSEDPSLKCLVKDLYGWIEEYVIFGNLKGKTGVHNLIVYLWIKKIRDDYNFCIEKGRRAEVWQKIEGDIREDYGEA